MGLIFLCGLPGSGKTTVGKLVAEKRELPFIDLDAIIELDTGRTIPELFAQQGEACFRELESQALKQACRAKDAVVALGAGVFERHSNFKIAYHAGLLIYLKALPEFIAERLLNSKGRPLFKEHATREQVLLKLGHLLAKRETDYDQSHIVIELGKDESPEQITKRLMNELSKYETA